MQLEYNVLWIDNEIQSSYIERGQINALAEYIKNLGFEPSIVTLVGGEDLSAYLHDIKFDLIVSDYNLDNGLKGDKLVEDVRTRGLMTEVLFYSANSKLLDDPVVRGRIASLDRISFHSGREGLMDKIDELIKLTVSKLLELNATRGVIMAETSALDVSIEELTLVLCQTHLNKQSDHLDDIVTQYVEDCLGKKAEKFEKDYAKHGFEFALKKMEASRKWNLFRKLLKELRRTGGRQDLTDFIDLNGTYSDEVINVRNKFAHAKTEKINGKMILKGMHDGDHFEVNDEECVKIRKNLIKHKESITKLHSSLVSE